MNCLSYLSNNVHIESMKFECECIAFHLISKLSIIINALIPSVEKFIWWDLSRISIVSSSIFVLNYKQRFTFRLRILLWSTNIYRISIFTQRHGGIYKRDERKVSSFPYSLLFVDAFFLFTLHIYLRPFQTRSQFIYVHENEHKC